MAWPILSPEGANWRGDRKLSFLVDLAFLKRVNPLKINPKKKVFRKKAVFGHFQYAKAFLWALILVSRPSNLIDQTLILIFWPIKGNTPREKNFAYLGKLYVILRYIVLSSARK